MSGLVELRARLWAARNTFGAAPPLPELVEAKRGESIAVVLPAVDEEVTIGRICRTIHGLQVAGLVDDLLVMDGGSSDGTAGRARAEGARVVRVEPAGKGDALWRSLAEIDASIVVWLDADVRNFAEHFVTRLVAPLLAREDLVMVKAFYDRPLDDGTALHSGEGGRVTELTVRPLLEAFFPELCRIRQPLAGEYAARTDSVRRLPFRTGYDVEIALLIDLLGETGIDAIAQADLGERVHRNRPLSDLAPMAREIATAILERASDRGRRAHSGRAGGEHPPHDGERRARRAP